jgi:hypothetical protein
MLARYFFRRFVTGCTTGARLMIGVGLVVGVALTVGLAGVARIGVDKIGGVDTVGSALPSTGGVFVTGLPVASVVTGASVDVPSAPVNPDLSVVGATVSPPEGAAVS